MYRGSTPTFSFELPFASSEVDMDKSLITFEQDDEVVLEKTLNECVRDGRVYHLTLTQEESFEFETGRANVQINLIMVSGQRLPSQEFKLKIVRNLHDEVIEVAEDGND